MDALANLKQSLEVMLTEPTPEAEGHLIQQLEETLHILKNKRGGNTPNLLDSAMQAINETWRTGRPPQKLPIDLGGHTEFQKIITDLVSLQQFTTAVSKGDLNVTIKIKGMIAGSLKSLQANLRHLTWQVQQISKGDFKQKVDFMGEFSEAFNSMTSALAQAQADLLQREAELSAANAELRNEIAERERAQAAELATMQREMNLARNIQMSLLPPSVSAIEGVDIASICIPAREVGGDLYGYYELSPTVLNPHGGYAFALGDVSGKGIPAALYMAVCVTLLAAKIPLAVDASQLLNEMNHILYPYMSPNRMNTALCYLRLEPRAAGSYQAYLANAGLIAPLLRRGSQCDFLEIGGLPLGAINFNLPYIAIELSLQKDDVLVLCSDGIAEAMNGAREMYGLDRLRERVAECPGTTAQSMQDWVLEGVHAFIGNVEPHDDLTLMSLVIRN